MRFVLRIAKNGLSLEELCRFYRRQSKDGEKLLSCEEEKKNFNATIHLQTVKLGAVPGQTSKKTDMSWAYNTSHGPRY